MYIKKSFKVSSFAIVSMALSGCGFTPLYSPATSPYSIKIATVPNREGQMLKNELMTLFSSEKSYGTSYYLEPKISFNQSELGLRRDATAKRQTVTATIAFKLMDQTLDKAIYQDVITVTASYNVGSTANIAAVSMIASEKDARMRLMHQAAQEIKILVESFLIKYKK